MDDFMANITAEEMYDDEMMEFMCLYDDETAEPMSTYDDDEAAEFAHEIKRKNSRAKKISRDDFDVIRDPEYDYDDYTASYYGRDYED